jgi:hypothetical protein
MVEEVKDFVRWTWMGPLLISVLLMMIAAWSFNMDRRVSRMEDAVAELIRARGEMSGKLETIINQNASQDLRMTQISSRLDTLVTLHIDGNGLRKVK